MGREFLDSDALIFISGVSKEGEGDERKRRRR
jgi:hypothetical protein